jgi:hypothetical protein
MSFSARAYFALSLLLLAIRLPAQQTPYVVGSTVSGHVICEDTNAPARFAKVLLKSTAPSHAGEDMMKSITDSLTKSTGKSATPPKPQTDDQKKALVAASRGMDQVTDMLNSSTVGLDGSYSFAGVKPGTYYIHAIYPGYIDPFSQFTDEDFASTDPAIRARIAQVPTITVTGTDSAHADLRLVRGAAIDGRILYDDGTPAVGWSLTVIKPRSTDDPNEAVAAAMAPALSMMGIGQPSKTDDRGLFRIAGLAAGEYALRASLTATPTGISAANMGDAGGPINLAVYTGDTFTRADAKPVKLAAGDEISGVDITIPSHKLHNISGHVIAKSDGHTLNVGQVVLTVKDNPATHVVAAIRDDGSFHFEDLPGNVTYTLTVADAADGRNDGPPNNFMGISMPNPEILRKYGTDTTTILLADSDVDAITLSVTPNRLAAARQHQENQAHQRLPWRLRQRHNRHRRFGRHAKIDIFWRRNNLVILSGVWRSFSTKQSLPAGNKCVDGACYPWPGAKPPDLPAQYTRGLKARPKNSQGQNSQAATLDSSVRPTILPNSSNVSPGTSIFVHTASRFPPRSGKLRHGSISGTPSAVSLFTSDLALVKVSARRFSDRNWGYSRSTKCSPLKSKDLRT